MDLNHMNPVRRKRERNIAREVAREFFQSAPSDAVAPPELLAHLFGTVCHRLRFIPDEAEATRILQYVSNDIAR